MATQTTEHLYPEAWNQAIDTGANYAQGMPSWANTTYQNWFNQPLSTGQTPYQTQAYNAMMNPDQQWLQGVQGAQQATLGFNPYQQQAANALNPWGATLGSGLQALGEANPLMDQAAQAYTTGSQYDQSQLQQYLNPYTQNAAEATTRALTRNLMENILPGVNSTFAGTGQFGSTRNADFTNRAIQNTQLEAADAIAKANYGAYDQAHRAYSDWANKEMAAGQGLSGLAGQQMNLAQGYGQLGTQYGALSNAYSGLGQNQLSYANQLGSLAGAGANLTQQQLTNMLTAAQAQQKQQQEALTANYQDWLTQQQFPLSALNAVGTALGNMSKGVTPNINIPVAEPNDMDKILVALSAVQGGLSDDAIQGLLSNLGLEGLFG